MIIIDNDRSYTSDKEYIQGSGFIDSLSSNLRNFGSYILQNKDLITKPMLGAAGELAAFATTEVGRKAITKMMNKNPNNNNNKPVSIELLQQIMNGPNKSNFAENPTANIIGSGIKKKKNCK